MATLQASIGRVRCLRFAVWKETPIRFLDECLGRRNRRRLVNTFNMFAKSGTGFTPFWICDDCNPVEPGNIGVSSIDAVGDFNADRPIVRRSSTAVSTKDRRQYLECAASVCRRGSRRFSNPANAKRNLLWVQARGASTRSPQGFHFGERVTAQLGADVDNVFNHPLFLPDADTGGGGGTFALLGDFNIRVDPATGKLVPIGQNHPRTSFLTPTSAA